jgi:integral membrane sensor domain MASE1
MNTDPQVPEYSRRSSKPVVFSILLFIVLVCIDALAAKFAVFSFGIAPGVSSIYVVVAVMIVFTLWFGMWGAFAAYAGCYIGAGMLGGIPAGINLVWSLADSWQVIIPLLAFRTLKVDASPTDVKDILALLIFGVLLNNLAGAFWGSTTLALGGVISWSGVIPVFYGWLSGNVISCLVLVPALLYFVTPVIRDHDLIIRKYWQ